MVVICENLYSFSGEKMMANDKKYPDFINWPLLNVPDEQGQLHYPDIEQSVRQSIEIILRTTPNEQLMRPRFGAGLEQFLQEQNTLTTRQQIKELIVESLERWEKRVRINLVEVWPVAETPTQVRVEIAYRIIATGAVKNIGLSMELES